MTNRTPIESDKCGKKYTPSPSKEDVVQQISQQIVTNFVAQRRNAELLLMEYHEMIIRNGIPYTKQNLQTLYDDNKNKFINITFNDFRSLYTGLCLSYESN